MSALYVVTPNANVQLRGGRLVVTADGEVLAAASLAMLSEVVLVGNAGITVPALVSLLDHDVRLVLLAASGRLRGRLVPPTGKNLARRRSLYRAMDDPDLRLSVSRAIVEAKIGNSLTLARRWTRMAAAERGARSADGASDPPLIVGPASATDGASPDDPEPPGPLAILAAQAAAVAVAPDLAALRGVEGTAARAYFGVLRDRLDPAYPFPRRSRRPPRDTANAVLSACYSLLTGTAVSAVETAGLDPHAGLYHAAAYGRPALALDLVEEFRAYVADSLMLRLLNRSMLGPHHVTSAADAVFLSPAGWRIAADQYGRRLHQTVRHRCTGRSRTVRDVIGHQARQLAAVTDGRAPAYRPFRIR